MNKGTHTWSKEDYLGRRKSSFESTVRRSPERTTRHLFHLNCTGNIQDSGVEVFLPYPGTLPWTSMPANPASLTKICKSLLLNQAPRVPDGTNMTSIISIVSDASVKIDTALVQ